PRATIVIGVAGKDHYRNILDSSKAGDDGSTPTRTDLHKGVGINQRIDDRPHFVNAAGVLGNRIVQPPEILRLWRARFRYRRQFMYGAWQIGKESTHPLECLFLSYDFIITHPIAGVNVAA